MKYTSDSIILNRSDIDQIDWRAASVAIRAFPGHLVVEMASMVDTSAGGIIIADFTKADARPGVGVVLSSGTDGLVPGDVVAVRPQGAQWVEEFEVPGYKTARQIRIYGCIGRYTAVPPNDVKLGDVSEWVQATLGDDMKLKAWGTNVLVRRDGKQKTWVGKSGIAFELPDEAQTREHLGTIVECGNLVSQEVKDSVGMKVHYCPTGVVDFALDEDEDLVMIREAAINFLMPRAGVFALPEGVYSEEPRLVESA